MIGGDFSEPLVVTLMPRVLGQGGFASSEMYISFLDRNYAGNMLEMVLHHEMVHILDNRLGGEMRPTILIEGLAVYLSGGHYKLEDLIPRAAALLRYGYDSCLTFAGFMVTTPDPGKQYVSGPRHGSMV